MKKMSRSNQLTTFLATNLPVGKEEEPKERKMCQSRKKFHQLEEFRRRKKFVISTITHLDLILILIIFSTLDHWSVECAKNKKKVLIIGEIPDEAGSFTSSSPSFSDEGGRGGGRRGQGGEGSVFVPVAAYSVTHSRVAGDRGHGESRRRSRPVRKHYRIKPAASSPQRTTESAVYGYVQKPEIVEFRGQYFYGPNDIGSSGSSSRNRPHYTSASAPAGWTPVQRYSAPKSGGLGPGGLLLATLPLILAPMLSYLFTPMVIPVTATIAAGRRRKRSSENSNITEGMMEDIFPGMNFIGSGKRGVREKDGRRRITEERKTDGKEEEEEIEEREDERILSALLGITSSLSSSSSSTSIPTKEGKNEEGKKEEERSERKNIKRHRGRTSRKFPLDLISTSSPPQTEKEEQAERRKNDWEEVRRNDQFFAPEEEEDYELWEEENEKDRNRKEEEMNRKRNNKNATILSSTHSSITKERNKKQEDEKKVEKKVVEKNEVNEEEDYEEEEFLEEDESKQHWSTSASFPSSSSSSPSSTASSSVNFKPRLKEIQLVANYLRKVHFDEVDRDKAMAKYLQCDGMLEAGDNNHCLERLSCEFSDPNSSSAPQLDRQVTSILLAHILNNEYISNGLKKALKLAAIYGRDHSGKCSNKFPCSRIAPEYHNPGSSSLYAPYHSNP